MICPNQSNRGPLKEKKEKELKCGSLPTADIVGAVGKSDICQTISPSWSWWLQCALNKNIINLPCLVSKSGTYHYIWCWASTSTTFFLVAEQLYKHPCLLFCVCVTWYNYSFVTRDIIIETDELVKVNSINMFELGLIPLKFFLSF